MPPHRQITWRLKLISFLLDRLSEIYGRLVFCCHHQLDDLRPLSWFNYHTPERGQFNLSLEYTAIVDLAGIDDFDTYLRGIRKNRQRDLMKAQRAGFRAEISDDIDAFDLLHRLSYERQGLSRPEVEEENLRNIATAALKGGFGQLLAAYDKSGEPASAALFLNDERSGYYMFGANHPLHREHGTGTLVMLEALRHYWEKGLTSFDFLGINSPNRGNFKTSFNAIPTPYLYASWKGV